MAIKRSDRADFKVFCIGVMLFFLSGAAVQAEDGLICAEVAPCAADGSVLPPYHAGECSSYYAAVCAQTLVNRLSGEVGACYQEQAQQGEQISKLKKKLKRLRQKVRARQ